MQNIILTIRQFLDKSYQQKPRLYQVKGTIYLIFASSLASLITGIFLYRTITGSLNTLYVILSISAISLLFISIFLTIKGHYRGVVILYIMLAVIRIANLTFTDASLLSYGLSMTLICISVAVFYLKDYQQFVVYGLALASLPIKILTAPETLTLSQSEPALVIGSLIISIALSYSLAKLVNKHIFISEKYKEQIAHNLITQQKLRQLNDVKDKFLRGINHEFRNPLNIILGFSDLLLADSSDKPILDHAKHIKSAADDLHRKLRNLIEFRNHSTMENPDSLSTMHTISSREFFETSTEFVLPLIQGKEIRFDTDLDDSLPEYFSTNRTMLQIIIHNILDNAVKFTEKGHILLQASLVNIKSVNHLVIAISDSGIGIQKSKIPLIFNDFYQCENKLSKKYPGMGIGLTIARQYIQSLHGNIQVQSAIKAGSVFTVSIPVTAEQSFTAPVGNVPSRIEGDLRILIVDDEQVNHKLIEAYLAEYPVQITSYFDSQGLKEHLETQSYHLILMDVELPGRSGLELSLMIKEIRSQKDTIVIGVTGHAEQGFDIACRKAKMQECLVKPISQDLLVRMIHRYFDLVTLRTRMEV